MEDASRAKLGAWLRYFDDLGIPSLFRDRIPLPGPASASPVSRQHAKPAPSAVLAPASSSGRAIPTASPVRPAPPAEPFLFGEMAAPAPVAVPLRIENDSLERIRADIGDCTRCKLCERRTNIVFGDGNPRAQLVFVGEGPGHEEDLQGLPFVGRAGKLLTDMVAAMGLKRSDAYICNVVKCRPPENRTPERDEVATCSPFLYRQLEVIQPKVIVALGASAVKAMLGEGYSITKVRGQWFEFRGFQLLPTYHPAYLLRNPNAKPDAWKDLQKVMDVLGLQPYRKK